MSENFIVGIIAYISIFVVLFVYYLIRAGYLKYPLFKKKSKIAQIADEQKRIEIEKKAKEVKEKDLKHLTEVLFLIRKYDLDWHYLYKIHLLFIYVFIDTTIIVGTFELIMLVDWNLLFRLALGFVLLLGLIYSFYCILGSILLKRGYVKNEHK